MKKQKTAQTANRSEVQFLAGTKLHSHVKRDAIHIPCVSVEAGGTIYPGNRVKYVAGQDKIVMPVINYYDKGHGVADPWLITNRYDCDSFRFNKGDIFLMYLYPNSISFLSHVWEHKEIDEYIKNTDEASVWLRKFADRWGMDFDEMINAACVGDYITAMGRDLHNRFDLGEDYDLFWMYLEQYKNTTFSDEHRDRVGWSCSC